MAKYFVPEALLYLSWLLYPIFTQEQRFTASHQTGYLVFGDVFGGQVMTVGNNYFKFLEPRLSLKESSAHRQDIIFGHSLLPYNRAPASPATLKGLSARRTLYGEAWIDYQVGRVTAPTRYQVHRRVANHDRADYSFTFPVCRAFARFHQCTQLTEGRPKITSFYNLYTLVSPSIVLGEYQ